MCEVTSRSVTLWEAFFRFLGCVPTAGGKEKCNPEIRPQLKKKALGKG